MSIKKPLLALSVTCLFSSALAINLPTWETQITIPSGSIQSIKSDSSITVKQISTDSLSVTAKKTCSSNISTGDADFLSQAVHCLSNETGNITLNINQDNGKSCSVTMTETFFGGSVSVTESSCSDISVGDFDNQIDGMDYTLSSDYTGIDWY